MLVDSQNTSVCVGRPKGSTDAAAKELVEKIEQATQEAVREFHEMKSKNKSSLKGEDKRVFNLVKKNFYKASRNLRAQLGQKDRFRKGIERSGLYLKEIKKCTFAKF